MTEEELKTNIDAGREWLEANYFDHEGPIDGYFQEMRWQNPWRNVEIVEPSEDVAKMFMGDGYSEEYDIWTCSVGIGDHGIDDWTQTYGFTLKEAMEKSLAEYGKEMAVSRKQRFAAILGKEDKEK